MPLYEYTCERCGASVEKLQSRGAAPPAVCPSCGAEGTLHRGISKTSFHLKGGGWYVTDYTSPKGGGGGGDTGGDGGGDTDSGSTEAASDTGGSSDTGSSGDSDSA